MDIREKLKEKMPGLSKGQRALASYILEKGENAAFLTAARLAKEAGVSESTAVRFAMELGYEGYPAMQRDLQKLVLLQVKPERSSRRPKSQEIFRESLSRDAERLRRTWEGADLSQTERCLSALEGAEEIFILGDEPTGCLSQLMAYEMEFLFTQVRTADCCSPRQLLPVLERINPGDRVLLLSFMHPGPDTMKAVRKIREKRACLILLTDRAENPLEDLADHTLHLCPQEGNDIPSPGAPVSFLSAFCRAADERLKRGGKKEYARTQAVLDRWAKENR